MSPSKALSTAPQPALPAWSERIPSVYLPQRKRRGTRFGATPGHRGERNHCPLTPLSSHSISNHYSLFSLGISILFLFLPWYWKQLVQQHIHPRGGLVITFFPLKLLRENYLLWRTQFIPLLKSPDYIIIYPC